MTLTTDSKRALTKALGADRIELYTEAYAKAFGKEDQDAVLQQYVDAAGAAQSV